MIPQFIPPREIGEILVPQAPDENARVVTPHAPRDIGHVRVPSKTENLNGIVEVLQRPVIRTTPPIVEQPRDFTTRSLLRHPDPYATATKVVNLGTVDVKVYENNIVVGVALVGGFINILPGKGKIEGEGIGDDWSASVNVYTTHGSTPNGPYPAAPEPDPIGSFLL